MHLFIHSKTNNQEMTSFCCLYAILRYYHYKHDIACMMEDLQGQPFNFSNFIKLLDLYRIEYKYCTDYKDIFNRKGSVFLIHTLQGSILYMGSIFNIVVFMDPLRGYCLKTIKDFFEMDILDIIDITFIGRYPFYHQSILKLYENFKFLILKIFLILMGILLTYIFFGQDYKIILFYGYLITSGYLIMKMFYTNLESVINNEQCDFFELFYLYKYALGIRIIFFIICFFEILGLVLLNVNFIPLYIVQQFFCIMESVFIFQKSPINTDIQDVELKKVLILENLKSLIKSPIRPYVKYIIIILHFLLMIIYSYYPNYIFLHLFTMIIIGLFKSYLLNKMSDVRCLEQSFFIKKYQNLKNISINKIESIKIYDHHQWKNIDYFYICDNLNLFCKMNKLKINEYAIHKNSLNEITNLIAYYRVLNIPSHLRVIEYLNPIEMNTLFCLTPVFKISQIHQKIGELDSSYQELVAFVKAYHSCEPVILFDRCFHYLSQQDWDGIIEFIKFKQDKRVILSVNE